MADIGDIIIVGIVSDTLLSLGVKPKKSRGQNFLLNRHDGERLVRDSVITEGANVLEVGPGLGMMTQVLLEKGYIVTAIEIEKLFAEYLSKQFQNFGANFKVQNIDFREFEINSPTYFVSNVPYSLSTEMILWLVKYSSNILGASLLLQREFSERLAASPGSKQYGSLSVYIQSKAKVKLGVIIAGSCFYPAADVESRQILIDFSEPPDLGIKNYEVFEKVVRACFSMRRKKLLAGLKRDNLIENTAQGEQILESLKISPNARAEELSIQQFAMLANAF